MNPSDAQHAPPAMSRIAVGLAVAAMAVLLANVLLVGYDIALRWLLRQPQSWVSDLAAVSYPIALACCIPAALESGHMIAIRFLGEAIGSRTTRVLDLMGSALLSVFLVLIAWKVTERAVADWGAGYRTVNIGLPIAPTWAIVALLLAIAALVQLRLTFGAVFALGSAAPRVPGHG